MADGGIGEQPLDVLLPDRGERTERHRGHRDCDHNLLPLHRRVREGPEDDADDHGHGRHFRRRGEIGGDGGWRAFIDVRRPHMEGHRGDLEGKAGHHEDQAENKGDWRSAVVLHRRGHGFGDAGEFRMAGVAVDQRGAVEQQPGRQRAQHEIFEARPVERRRSRRNAAST